MSLKGKRVAILAENNYQEMELWVPYYRLKEEGAEVKVVGAGGAKSYHSKTGYPVNRRPTNRILRSGDMIFTAHYTRFGGYYSHPHVALSLGPIPPDYRAMRDAVFEDTQRALAILKPGTPWEEVDRELDQGCLRGGFYHEIPQVHGIGLDGVEPPLTTMTRGKVPPELAQAQVPKA